MSRRLLNWRILLALFFSVNLALAPAIAEARAGSSYGGSSSGMGSRGSRTFENNGGQPLSRSVTPLPATPRPPGLAPAMPSPAYGGGSFFQRHPFLTGLAGGFVGSWLFGHSGYAAEGDGGSSGSMLGMLLQILIIGLLIISRCGCSAAGHPPADARRRCRLAAAFRRGGGPTAPRPRT
jgi:hypothetical protein